MRTVSVAGLALVLAAGPANASLDETLDLSLHGAHTVGDDVSPRTGAAARVGITSRDVRFGAGVGTANGVHGAEAYLGWTHGGFWKLRPSFELRAHAERIDDATKSGLGARVAVLVPLSEYFFLDLGAGRDLIGAERFRATIGIGLPIPLSHL